jgi:hypothetical protein
MPKTSLYAKVSVVVATKDRPGDLRTMLQSLAEQSCRPDQVVIVDSSAAPVQSVLVQAGIRLLAPAAKCRKADSEGRS